MSTNRNCKTAKDSRCAKIRVGDCVTAISPNDGNPMNTGTVVEMWRQGYDGTILKLDVPPDPQYPHHWSHQASKTVKAALPPADKTLHERQGHLEERVVRSTIPKAWPQCSDCKAAYVLRRAIVFASKPGSHKATMRHEWVWQRDCKHRKAAPEIYPPSSVKRSR